MRLLRTISIVAGVLILAGFAALVSASLFVSAEQSFVNEIEIAATPEQVWQVVTDKHRYTEWQPQLTRVDVIDDANWVEYATGAPEPLKFRLVSDERPKRMRFEYSMGDSMHGTWEGEIVPAASGVRLRTVDGFRTESRFTKLLMAVFFDLDAFAKDWNNKLKHRVETLD